MSVWIVHTVGATLTIHLFCLFYCNISLDSQLSVVTLSTTTDFPVFHKVTGLSLAYNLSSMMSETSKLPEYLAYRETTKILLDILGLWPLKKPSLTQRLLPFVSIIICSITSLAIFGFVLHHRTRVAIVVRGMSVGTSFLTSILKISLLLIHRERIIELHYILDQYISSAINDKRLRKIMLSQITIIRRLSAVLILTVFLAVAVYVLTPILSIINQKRHNVQPIEYFLLYPGLYPWDIHYNRIIYEIHFIIETLASIILFCSTCGIDALFAYYVFQMVGQLRAMTYNLTNPDNNKNLGVIIKECVDQYEVLLKCRDSIQIIFGPFTLWMMGTNAIILCTVMFQLTQMRHILIGKVIQIIAYIILKLTQTFIYSWSGSTLISQSEDYRAAVYETDWVAKEKSVMSAIIIMLNQRPLKLTALKFSVISIDMFVMILNTTMSYFFLLRTMEEKFQ